LRTRDREERDTEELDDVAQGFLPPEHESVEDSGNEGRQSVADESGEEEVKDGSENAESEEPGDAEDAGQEDDAAQHHDDDNHRNRTSASSCAGQQLVNVSPSRRSTIKVGKGGTKPMMKHNRLKVKKTPVFEKNKGVKSCLLCKQNDLDLT
jgi:hypothetical protein